MKILFLLYCSNRNVILHYIPVLYIFKYQVSQHNASAYGVHHKVEFRDGNYLQLEIVIKGYVILSLYYSMGWAELQQDFLDKILEVERKIASKILLYLPKNLDNNQVIVHYPA